MRPHGGKMAFSDFARGLRDVLRTAVRNSCAGLAGLALTFAVLCGLASPASAQSQVTIPGDINGVGWNEMGHYSNNGVMFAEQPGMGTGYELAYFTFAIPANRNFTSVTLRYNYQQHSGVSHPIYFVSLNGQPPISAAGQDEVQAGTVLASEFSGINTQTTLPASFLSAMNSLSAAGGGVMTIGAWGPEGIDYFGQFNAVSLEGVAPLPPSITSLSPNAGPLSGGAATLQGANFESATVTVSGFNVTPPSVTATTITFNLPPHGAGTVPVVVSTAGGVAAINYTYVAAPTVTSISPSAGPTGGGQTVVITGTGFSAAAATGAVKFGSANATYTINSNTQITATAPANAAGTYDITVTTPGGTSAPSVTGQYTYITAPTVTSISPSTGPSGGGQTVVITGTGFSAAAGTGAVKFGAANAIYTVNSNTQITATAPANAAGTYDITVTTPGGTSATSAADQYTYAATPTVTAISPSAGPTSGGQTVAITGTNFSGATSVTFGGTAATGYTVVNGTSIMATAPAGTGAVDIRVTTSGGTSAISAADMYTYVAAPTVTSISPSAGPISGGQAVTITGTNLSGATAVWFGGTAATGYTVMGGTSIMATAPAGTGVVDIRVTTSGGTSAVAVADQYAYTYTSAPIAGAVSATVAFGSVDNPVTLNLSGGPASGVTLTGGPSHGTAATIGTSMTYTPAPGYHGTDSFTYTATGPGGTSAPATVTVTVSSPSAPVATSTSAAVGYETAQTIDLSGSITGVHTSIAVVSGPSHGVVSVAGDVVTYTPADDYFGPDSFTYTATGPGGTSATATVTITVATPGAPTAATASVAAAYNSPTPIDLSGSITGVHTSIAVVSGPSHGAVSVAGDVVTYTPADDYFGPDSFTYAATGPGGTSAAATVTLTVAMPARPVVEQPAGPVVVPPSAGGGTIAVNLEAISQGEVDGYRITVSSRFGVAEVVDGAAAASLQAARTAAPRTAGKAAAGPYQLIYTPAANFMGTDTVTVVAYGPGGDSTPVTFTFQVAGKAPDLSGQATAGASVTFTPTAALVGGPFQALRITRAPDFGTATVNGLSLVFAPGANGGATSLDYVIDLPFGASAPGRIDLTANALPVAEALTAQTLQGVPVTVRISDAQGEPFTGAAVVSISPATAGEATVTKVGADYDLTFVSNGDFSGEAVVTYSLSNAFGTTSSTLTVTVEARPDPSLDPEVRGVATSQVTSARRFADAQINNFQQRLRDLHDGTNGSSNGLSLNLGLGGADEDRDPQQALRRQLGQDRNLDPGALGGDRDREMLGLDLWAGRTQAAPTVVASDDRLNAAAAQPATSGGASVGLWTSGSVDWGRQDATGQRDSRFTTQGATLGVDVKVSDQLIVGGGVGYGEDKTRIGDNGSVTNGKAFTGAVYASWRPAEAFYVDGVIGYADLDFTSRRWVEGLAGQADGYADGERSGDVRFASAAFGRLLRGERVVSDFYARLDARDITLNGFTETGGGLSALNWDEIEQKSLSANLGVSWRWTLDSRRYGQFRPNARIEWSHELEDISAQGVRYADWTTSPTYLVPLNAWSRNVLNLDLGSEWSLSDRLMLSLGYRGVFGDASTSHGGQIGMKYGW